MLRRTRPRGARRRDPGRGRIWGRLRRRRALALAQRSAEQVDDGLGARVAGEELAAYDFHVGSPVPFGPFGVARLDQQHQLAVGADQLPELVRVSGWSKVRITIVDRCMATTSRSTPAWMARVRFPARSRIRSWNRRVA